MCTRFVLALFLGTCLASPTFATDKKLDPDPAFLMKARTAATATVEAHYDISDKAPFPARFAVCAGQLTAIRDEGRALPLPHADLEKLIGEYRNHAIELQAYRTKSDAKAAAAEIDGQIVKIVSGTMDYLPGDTTRLGVERMKMLHGQRLAFCRLTRDWYETQNGLRAPTPTADQQVIARATKEAERQTIANAPKPPMPSAIGPMPPPLKPSTVQPIQRAPVAAPVPAAKVIVPAAGVPNGGLDARDVKVGIDLTQNDARADFAGRPLWSALAECGGRMDLIQSKTGHSTRLQSESYAKRAAYVLWGNRGSDVSGSGLSAMAAPVQKERARLGARIAASWEEHRQRTGQLPDALWGQVCGHLDQYALAQAGRIHAAKKAQADREHAEAMRRVQHAPPMSAGTTTSSGSYAGPTNSGAADHARATAEHQRTMQNYERQNQQIRQEIKAIDRKYR